MINKDEANMVKKLVWIGSVGIVMVVCTFLGLLIGYFLDKLFHTGPLFTIGFLILGIVAGFWTSFDMIIKCIKE
jgi:ATP synthase protein I